MRREPPDGSLDAALHASAGLVAGVDEVGRGALAGPVTVAAVIGPPVVVSCSGRCQGCAPPAALGTISFGGGAAMTARWCVVGSAKLRAVTTDAAAPVTPIHPVAIATRRTVWPRMV